MKEHKIKYAKSLAIKNFNKINNQLNERFKLTTFGDGKYQIIEGILKQTVDIALKICENKSNNTEENDYHSKLDSLLSKFKQGGELYRVSPIFNTTIQMMLKGLNPYEAIEELILMNERTQEAFEDYVKKSSSNHSVLNSDNKLFDFKKTYYFGKMVSIPSIKKCLYCDNGLFKRIGDNQVVKCPVCKGTTEIISGGGSIKCQPRKCFLDKIIIDNELIIDYVFLDENKDKVYGTVYDDIETCEANIDKSNYMGYTS